METCGSLRQYYRDKSGLNNARGFIDFPIDNNNNSVLLKFKEKIIDQTGEDGTTNAEIMMPLKYLNNFLKTLEIPIINCEINLTVTRSGNCVISSSDANQATTFTRTDLKLYVPFVTL